MKNVVRPITSADWGPIEALFGPRGACADCWCMYWRVPSTGKYWERFKGARAKHTFRSLIESGEARGALAFGGDEPVGWASFGPREDFPYLQRSRKLPREAPTGTWCVNCFFVRSGFRNRGVAAKLLACATAAAKAAGASALDGFPVVPQTGKPVPPAFAHTGLPSLFEAAGFRRIADAGGRLVYRRTL